MLVFNICDVVRLSPMKMSNRNEYNPINQLSFIALACFNIETLHCLQSLCLSINCIRNNCAHTNRSPSTSFPEFNDTNKSGDTVNDDLTSLFFFFFFFAVVWFRKIIRTALSFCSALKIMKFT